MNEIKKTNRLHNLDYLRGLMAFFIMIYHYSVQTYGIYDASSVLGRIGIYGVAIFYILSGLTLYHVYYSKLELTKGGLFDFFKKRIYRIFPLLWLVTITAIILSRTIPDFSDLLLNLSGLFGFFKWDTYFSQGLWSIGNELVFYAFFPFFIFFMRKSKILMLLISASIVACFGYFTFVSIDESIALGSQWSNYVNPLNQVFLFLLGFYIIHWFKNIRFNNWILSLLLILSISIFLFYPVEGFTSALVVNTNRLILTACAAIICLCFYKLRVSTPIFIHTPLKILGEASYSVYLLHPIVFMGVGYMLSIFNESVFQLPIISRMLISVVVTLVASYLSYEYFEKYFIKLSRTKKII